MNRIRYDYKIIFVTNKTYLCINRKKKPKINQ